MKMKKLINILVITLFLVSISSCRPRYLRCGKKRYCEVQKEKEYQEDKTMILSEEMKVNCK